MTDHSVKSTNKSEVENANSQNPTVSIPPFSSPSLADSFGIDAGSTSQRRPGNGFIIPLKDEVDFEGVSVEEPSAIELELPPNTADIVDTLVTATYTTR